MKNIPTNAIDAKEDIFHVSVFGTWIFCLFNYFSS